MKTRCLELEMSNEEYQKKYERLDEDRADIIAYLKRILQEREDDIMELRERLAGVQKVHGNSFLYNDPWFVSLY
jgi:mRNA-degrading endonuclease RelE of RelBE toxin-antitoxin system